MSIGENGFHVGPISCVDFLEIGLDFVSVGEDGRVNLVRVDDSRISYRRVWDSNGLLGYNAAKWASPTEFVTGGLGFGLQWWDTRKPGGPFAQFKPTWPERATSGIVHSIDIHQSRKHTCVAGCSSGTVFAWDLRWQHQPIILSGVGSDEKLTHSPCESDVWKVQYDNYTSSSSRILPAMICSEDGILAVIDEGEDPLEILAEPCAINSFDIDQQNPSDVICCLEWESIALVTRP